MIYADYQQYAALYEPIEFAAFQRLSWDASKYIDGCVTGVDGVNKLRTAYPEEADAAESIRRCTCSLINAMQQVERAQASAGYTLREDGGAVGRVITAISSGAESISYSAGTGNAYTLAASDAGAKAKLYHEIVEQYLSDVQDANGVNLLFMGAYPNVH